MKYTQETFVQKALNLHKERYDYSLIEYKTQRTKIKIICSVHGIFEQYPFHHLSGSGCKQCGIDERSKKQIKQSQIALEGYLGYKFVEQFQVKFLGYEQVKIKCDIHGDQITTILTLKRNRDCPKCIHEKRNPQIVVCSDWKKYIQAVRAQTNKSWRHKRGFFCHYGEKRGRTDYHIDHEFSMLDGFKNDVQPEIIGHWTNLHMIPYDKNIRKGAQSTKSLEMLYMHYEWGKRKYG